jgi:hypothetical protein
MFRFTYVVALTVAGYFIASGQPVRAEEVPSGRHSISTSDLKLQKMSECHLLRRAISRHACHARLQFERKIDIVEN